MRNKQCTIWILGIVLLVGCEEPFIWERPTQNTDLIVVEAVLTNENKNHLIKLSKPYATQNQTPEPASGATVIIKSSSGNITTTEMPSGSGIYITDSISFVTNIDYELSIQYNAKTYTAKDAQPAGEALTPLLYNEVSDGMYTLNFTDTSSQIPNYIKYYISWQHLAECPTDTICAAKLINYDLRNIDIHKEFKAAQERIDFPAGTVVIRRKYSVSNNYKEYLRGILSETVWRGGVFDVFPDNAPTNLEGGAVGFFAISTVVMDTTVITE